MNLPEADLEGQQNFYRESNTFHKKSKAIKKSPGKNFAAPLGPPVSAWSEVQKITAMEFK